MLAGLHSFMCAFLQIIQSIPIIGHGSGSDCADIEIERSSQKVQHKSPPARTPSLSVLATSTASSATSGTHSDLEMRLQTQFPVSSCLIPESGSFSDAWSMNSVAQDHSQLGTSQRTTRLRKENSNRKVNKETPCSPLNMQIH